MRWSRTQVELLMDISATLADLTGTLSTCEMIPEYLGNALDFRCLSIAVVRDAGEPSLILQASSRPLSDGEGAANLTQNLLALYQRTKPLTTSDGPTLRSGLEEGFQEGQELAMQRLGEYPRATVLPRTLDAQHRMLLIVHQTAEEPSLSAGLSDLLQLVGDELAKLLSALISWRERGEHVGEPFDRLTDREWVVLQGLMTEAGEKQLADQLGLSPHTLHSHIKSIYRKIEVQGRLPLLTKVQSLMRERRVARVNCPKEPAGLSIGTLSATAG
jgi:DNA-binding CsgD family transcriptional regulator